MLLKPRKLPFAKLLVSSAFPFTAPSTGTFSWNSPLGARLGCRALAKGQESLLPAPAKSEERKEAAVVGRLFFGYFLLATQKKVSRLSVREPT